MAEGHLGISGRVRTSLILTFGARFSSTGPSITKPSPWLVTADEKSRKGPAAPGAVFHQTPPGSSQPGDPGFALSGFGTAQVVAQRFGRSVLFRKRLPRCSRGVMPQALAGSTCEQLAAEKLNMTPAASGGA